MPQPSKRLLFVCLGNICRSPAAEGVVRKHLNDAGLGAIVEVRSAGTAGYHIGDLPDRRMRAAAQRRGYTLESRARQFSADDFETYDLIVTMDDQNRSDVLSLARNEGHRAKVRSFCEFCSERKDTFVPDPYYGGPEGFEDVLDLLEDGTKRLLEWVGK